MRFFIHRSGATLQTPDKLDDIFQYELECGIIEECAWTWYISTVKQNKEAAERRFGNAKNPDLWEVYIHAKYYPKEYQMEDRISEKHNKKYASV